MSFGPELPRPLDLVRSLKVKLGLVIALSVIATVGGIFLFLKLGHQGRFAFGAGILISLVVMQVFAHGMVLPLREMAEASRAMAAGDNSRRVTATAQDEVGDLARSFNAMADKLDEAERNRQILIANVSHELRTPIAALRARLENLADGVEPFEPATAAAMLRSTERLGTLVDQLLELSQFEAGAIHLAAEAVPVADLFADAVEEVAPVDPSIAWVVDVEEGLVVRGDRDRLHEALTNLLTNAVRHSPDGGRVEVRASQSTGSTCLSVADIGPGIPPDELDRVFDRFHRVDGARTTELGGAGLGLAIARSITTLHGGTIRAENREPTGCRMVVDLPA